MYFKENMVGCRQNFGTSFHLKDTNDNEACQQRRSTDVFFCHFTSVTNMQNAIKFKLEDEQKKKTTTTNGIFSRNFALNVAETI